MKPSGTSSVPQRARRSAVEWTPPKLVASATSSQRVEEGLGALGGGEREADERPEWRHLPARHSADRAGWTTSSTSSRSRSARGERRRVRARSARAAARAWASERWASQASNAPGMEPDCERQRRSADGPLAVANGEGAEQDVGVPARLLVPLSIGEVGAERERLLAERRQRACCRPRASAPAACAASDTAAMSHTSSRGFDGVSNHTSARARRGRAQLASVERGRRSWTADARAAPAAPPRRARTPGIAVAAGRRAGGRAAAWTGAPRVRAAMPEAKTTDSPPVELAERAPPAASRCGFSSRP